MTIPYGLLIVYRRKAGAGEIASGLSTPTKLRRMSVAHKSNTLTQERLQELLHYDPETGVFTWRISRGRSVAGSRAGAINHHGYSQIQIDGVIYRAHNLAWLYVNGSFPTISLDHANCVKSDNRLDNLRVATNSQNGANYRVTRRNKSGYKGVTTLKRGYCAKIMVAGDLRYLGFFKSPIDAARAYDSAAVDAFGEYARGNFI